MTVKALGLTAERSGRTILHLTDVELKPGERVGLVGASGSGKSTLGHVLIDTLRAKGVSVAHVPQSPDEALDPLRTFAFHWREAERVLGLSADEARRRDLFNALQIEGGDLRKRPWGWSRGMQQRFVIAMALIGTPDVLVMDEPTEGLAPVIVRQLEELLIRLGREGDIDVLVIEQNIGVACSVASNVAIMVNGRINRVMDSGILAGDRDLQQALLGVGRHAHDDTDMPERPAAAIGAPATAPVTKIYLSNPKLPTSSWPLNASTAMLRASSSGTLTEPPVVVIRAHTRPVARSRTSSAATCGPFTSH